MNSESAFSHSLREALLRDARLLRLLGGTNVFEGYESDTSSPHINICASSIRDESSGTERDDEAVVTLHVWPQSGEKTRAHKIIEAAEQALARAGLLQPGSRILLQKNFAGARKLPDNGEFQGILRYHAERQPDAA